MLNIILDSHLRVPVDEFDPEWVEHLCERVSIRNEEKDAAIKEHIYGAKQLPDRICLVNNVNGHIVMPRGYFSEFKERLDKYGIESRIQDNRKCIRTDFEYSPKVILRDYQEIAAKAIEENQQGIISIPPGRGKTVIALCAISSLQLKSLIIVDKSNIAKQWQDRAEEHLGLELGIIGDGQWEEKPVTVAMQQTLWSRLDELDESNWWEKWGFVVLDESHHVSADTFFETANRFPAQYRIGVSATKGKSPAKEELAKFAFGPIIYEDDDMGMEPTIEVIDTPFDFDFRPTKKIKNKVIRNNYHDLVAAIVKDRGRNTIIAENIVKNKSHANLVISSRLGHLDYLRDLCIEFGFPAEKCYMLTGKEQTEARMQIYDLADAGHCAVFSTIADEALDIPRIDRIHLAFPSKNDETIKQRIGRGARYHDDKSDFIVYDYVDKCEVIQNQFKHRLRKYYQPNKFKVVRYGINSD